MLSRHAEAIYWLSRYMERAENTARVADVTYRTLLEISGDRVLTWETPLDINFGRFQYVSKVGARVENEEQVLEYLTFDPANPDSIYRSVDRARQNAQAIRDVISSEMVEELNKLHRWLQEARFAGAVHEHPHDFFQEVKTRCHLFEGLSANTILRDEGWQFHQAGRWLERGTQTARILEVQYAQLSGGRRRTDPDQHEWLSVLKSVAAYEAYRRQYLTQVQPRRVVELLVLDREFPRSVHSAVFYLVSAIQAITRKTGTGEGRSEPDRLARRLAGTLSTTLVDEVLIEGVPQFLARCQEQFRYIHDAISATYFQY